MIYLFYILTRIIERYLNSKIIHKYYKKMNIIKMANLNTNELLWKKEWQSLYTNNRNKPKVARFFEFKFLITLKIRFNGGQFYE